MSILYCTSCDASYDTDKHEDCPTCEVPMPSENDIREQVALKPCPCRFCGHDVAAEQFWFACDKASAFYHVFCLSCGAQGPTNSDLDEAITAWNTHPTRPEVGELAEELLTFPACDGLCVIPAELLDRVSAALLRAQAEIARTALTSTAGEAR